MHHDTYDFEEARKTVEAIRKDGASLIFNSSKTDAEIKGYVESLRLSDPFISEGGGLIFCPDGLFPDAPEPHAKEGGYCIYLLGRPVEELQASFATMRKALGLPLRAVFEMDDRELQRLTGLPGGKISLMRRRRASVPFVVEGETGVEELPPAREWAEAQGLRYTRGGRFHHLVGPSDKGTAAAHLAGMYRRVRPDVLTVALGDGLNDVPLLRWADRAIAIPAQEGLRPELAAIPGVRVAPAPGPAGWKAAVEVLFHELK